MEISDWVGRYNVTVRRCEERPDRPSGDVIYRLKDLFTTRDGSWEPSNQPGTLPQWARDRYLRPGNAPDVFDDAGADHHLFARVLDVNGQPLKDTELIQYWSDGFERLGDASYHNYVRVTPKQGSGWANHVVFNHFNPDRGERGAWCWCPRGAADVVVGGGMPNNHHISFFGVWQAEGQQAGNGSGNDNHTGETGPVVTNPLVTNPVVTSPTTAVGSAVTDALRVRAWEFTEITFNPSSAFMSYARTHALGAPITQEFDHGSWRAQGFANGIVYAPVNQWNSIVHMSW